MWSAVFIGARNNCIEINLGPIRLNEQFRNPVIYTPHIIHTEFDLYSIHDYETPANMKFYVVYINKVPLYYYLHVYTCMSPCMGRSVVLLQT